MKLEPDLIKDILQWCEDNLSLDNPVEVRDLIFKSYTTDQIIYHVYQLWKKGYLECEDTTDIVRTNYEIQRLTWDGHQYLALLNSKAWNTAKGVIHELGVIFAESAIKAVIDKSHL